MTTFRHIIVRFFDLFRWRYYISEDKNVGMSHATRARDRARCCALPFLLLLSGPELYCMLFHEKPQGRFHVSRSAPILNHFINILFVSLNIRIILAVSRSYSHLPVHYLLFGLRRETRCWILCFRCDCSRSPAHFTRIARCRRSRAKYMSLSHFMSHRRFVVETFLCVYSRVFAFSFSLSSFRWILHRHNRSCLCRNRSADEMMMMMSILWRAMMAQPPFVHETEWRIFHLLYLFLGSKGARATASTELLYSDQCMTTTPMTTATTDIDSACGITTSSLLMVSSACIHDSVHFMRHIKPSRIWLRCGAGCNKSTVFISRHLAAMRPYAIFLEWRIQLFICRAVLCGRAGTYYPYVLVLVRWQ